MTLPWRAGLRHPDPHQDVLKVAVLARHGVNRNIGRGFVRGFGLKSGALASSVGHDSHNVCVVGL
jgi:adenine deaminase